MKYTTHTHDGIIMTTIVGGPGTLVPRFGVPDRELGVSDSAEYR